MPPTEASSALVAKNNRAAVARNLQWAPIMFVVARHKGQSIHIGNDIEVVVTALSRTTVKLGIVAPKPLSILRTEIRNQIADFNRDALQNSNDQLSQTDDSSASTTIVTTARDIVTAVKSPTPPGVNDATCPELSDR